MRFSRMPEIRRGGNLRLFGLATVVVLVAAALIVYFTIGFGSHISQAVSPQDLGGSSNTNLAASSPVRALPPAQVAQVAATSIPESALKTKEQNSTPSPRQYRRLTTVRSCPKGSCPWNCPAESRWILGTRFK